MADNLDFYANVIATLQFSTPIEAIAISRLAPRAPGTPPEHWYDAMGRIRTARRLPDGPRSALIPRFRKPGG